MTTADAVAGVLLLALTLYAVFGGADFGAGLWTLMAGRGPGARGVREAIDRAVGPVWEANHVWLIFALVLTWTGFPAAFEAVMSTLFIPLSLAAVGIVLRGAGFAFQHVAGGPRGERLARTVYSVSSVLTPFMMGTVVGAVAAGRVPKGNAAGDPWTSWLNATSLVIGVLFVATCAYLAAVFLVSDARRFGSEPLERHFVRCAIAAAVTAGALAVVALFVLRADARDVYDGLTGEGLPLVIASVVCGVGALVVLWRRGRRGARPLAAGAVVAVVWGWGVAQYPYLLPDQLTIQQAAGASETLQALLIVSGAALLIVGAALGLLFSLDQRGLLEETAQRP